MASIMSYAGLGLLIFIGGLILMPTVTSFVHKEGTDPNASSQTKAFITQQPGLDFVYVVVLVIVSFVIPYISWKHQRRGPA